MNWLEKLRDQAQRPPVLPRIPLLWNGQVIGTVAQGFLDEVGVECLQGQRVATVERGAVRVLGVATHAVHLVGLAPDGRMWVQQRSANKSNHPHLWDTLMGGMVAAADTLEQALARETREEAGLDIAQLHNVQHGGQLQFFCPSDEVQNGIGYMRERIDWYSATVPQGMAPHNEDGEVQQFQCLDKASLLEWLVQGKFTPEASLVLGDYLAL